MTSCAQPAERRQVSHPLKHPHQRVAAASPRPAPLRPRPARPGPPPPAGSNVGPRRVAAVGRETLGADCRAGPQGALAGPRARGPLADTRHAGRPGSGRPARPRPRRRWRRVRRGRRGRGGLARKLVALRPQGASGRQVLWGLPPPLPCVRVHGRGPPRPRPALPPCTRTHARLLAFLPFRRRRQRRGSQPPGLARPAGVSTSGPDIRSHARSGRTHARTLGHPVGRSPAAARQPRGRGCGSSAAAPALRAAGALGVQLGCLRGASGGPAWRRSREGQGPGGDESGGCRGGGAGGRRRRRRAGCGCGGDLLRSRAVRWAPRRTGRAASRLLRRHSCCAAPTSAVSPPARPAAPPLTGSAQPSASAVACRPAGPRGRGRRRWWWWGGGAGGGGGGGGGMRRLCGGRRIRQARLPDCRRCRLLRCASGAHQSISQSVNQSVNQSISQSVSQSINQSISQ